jgi:hypothetical protein
MSAKKKKKQTKSRKVTAKQKTLTKSVGIKMKVATAKKAASKKKTALNRRKPRGQSESVNSVAYEPKGLGARSGGQSGDLQGLSGIAGADSESVDELIEEGNAFEAEIIKGVQDVRDPDEDEIRTHEVPEDDVPEEYLERDE